jgi:hypothetical protein
MVPLYAARIIDLKPGDFVLVECGACGHADLIPPAALPSLGFGPDERIVDLAPRLRCRDCDAKGKAVVSIRWGRSIGPGTRIPHYSLWSISRFKIKLHAAGIPSFITKALKFWEPSSIHFSQVLG